MVEVEPGAESWYPLEVARLIAGYPQRQQSVDGLLLPARSTDKKLIPPENTVPRK